MARPKKDAVLDLSQAHELTVGMIDRLACPQGKPQAFLRDTKAPGLRVRVTSAGAKSYVFESKLKRQTIRRTIGDVRAWSIDGARVEANRLRVVLDGGEDPRELERQQEAERAARAAVAMLSETTVREAWAAYLEDRKLHWGDRHYADHVALAKEGGRAAKRGTDGKGVTVAGPVHSLLDLRLSDLTSDAVEAWAAKEAQSRPTYGRLAWRCLKAFLNWCAEHPSYKAIVSTNPAKTKKARQAFGKPSVKTDVLLKEQLPAWFVAIRNISNSAVSAYLQTVLLTGARPGEVLEMRWEDVNEQWRGLTIRDKVEGERVIPLTPYVESLLLALPRRNEWVFASTRTVKMDSKNIARRERRAHAKGESPAPGEVAEASESGHISEPRNHHVTACKAAGLEGLTLHGLRRSFKSLTEWLEIPAGVVAQIMGHKPSATAEKHYTVRPLDLLRLHHERIEAWILKEGAVPFVAKKRSTKLHAVG